VKRWQNGPPANIAPARLLAYLPPWRVSRGPLRCDRRASTEVLALVIDPEVDGLLGRTVAKDRMLVESIEEYEGRSGRAIRVRKRSTHHNQRDEHVTTDTQTIVYK